MSLKRGGRLREPQTPAPHRKTEREPSVAKTQRTAPTSFCKQSDFGARASCDDARKRRNGGDTAPRKKRGGERRKGEHA